MLKSDNGHDTESLSSSEPVARTGEWRGVYRVLVGRPEGKIPLGRPRHKWEDNINLDFREVGMDGAN